MRVERRTLSRPVGVTVSLSVADPVVVPGGVGGGGGVVWAEAASGMMAAAAIAVISLRINPPMKVHVSEGDAPVVGRPGAGSTPMRVAFHRTRVPRVS